MLRVCVCVCVCVFVRARERAIESERGDEVRVWKPDGIDGGGGAGSEKGERGKDIRWREWMRRRQLWKGSRGEV